MWRHVAGRVCGRGEATSYHIYMYMIGEVSRWMERGNNDIVLKHIVSLRYF